MAGVVAPWEEERVLVELAWLEEQSRCYANCK